MRNLPSASLGGTPYFTSDRVHRPVNKLPRADPVRLAPPV